MKYVVGQRCAAAAAILLGLCFPLPAAETGRLLAYEGFDAIGGPLDGMSGTTSFGWDGEWEASPSHLIAEEGVEYEYVNWWLLHFSEDLSGNGLRDVFEGYTTPEGETLERLSITSPSFLLAKLQEHDVSVYGELPPPVQEQVLPVFEAYEQAGAVYADGTPFIAVDYLSAFGPGYADSPQMRSVRDSFMKTLGGALLVGGEDGEDMIGFSYRNLALPQHSSGSLWVGFLVRQQTRSWMRTLNPTLHFTFDDGPHSATVFVHRGRYWRIFADLSFAGGPEQDSLDSGISWRWNWADFIVLHFDFDESLGTIYVNPVAGIPKPVEPEQDTFRMYFEGTFSFDSDLVISRIGVTHNFFRPPVADVRVDEIRIADSYAALAQLPEFAPKPMRGAVTRLTHRGTEAAYADLPGLTHWLGPYSMTLHPDFGIIAHSDETDAFYSHRMERWLYPVMFTPGEYYLYDPESDRWWWSRDHAAGHYWSLEEELWHHMPGLAADGTRDGH